MTKLKWKPGTMLYPVPAAMVTCGSSPEDYNIITVAWTGTICSDPAMTYISIKPERYSHHIIKNSKEFVINLTTEDTARWADFCGVKSGRDVDKFKETGLTWEKANLVKCPLIKESPVNIECSVEQIINLGSHDMFIARVLAVDVDDQYIDEKGKFHLEWAKPVCYSHGQYCGLKKPIGGFGFSVARKKKSRR